VMMQEKRGMMKVWNVWLIFVTFMLSILGTLLTRAGLVSSVHAFAQSSIGPWFSSFLGIIFVVCLVTYIVNRKHLAAENTIDSLVSRESSFLFNNLVLLAVTFAILCGTLFPILSEAVRGYKINVGPPFFNKVTIPIGLFLVFLTAVGPLLAWGSTSFASIRRNFVFPTALSLFVGVLLIAFSSPLWLGVRQILHQIPVIFQVRSVSEFRAWWDSFDLVPFYTWMAMMLSILVLATVASEFIRGGRVLKEKLDTHLFGGMYHLARRNMRRYGGYIAHIGFAVVMIGLAGLFFNQENEQAVGMNESITIGHYKLVSQGSTEDDLPNYRSQAAMLDVYKDGQFLTRLNPAVFVYKPMDQPDHKVAIHHGLLEDLYVIYAGGGSERPIIKAFVNPLVSFVWIGVLILIFGTGLALVPNAAPVRAAVPATVAVPAVEDHALHPAGAGK